MHLDDRITHYGPAAWVGQTYCLVCAWLAGAGIADIANNTTDAKLVFAAVDQFFYKLYAEAKAA